MHMAEPWQKHRWCIDAHGGALTETSMVHWCTWLSPDRNIDGALMHMDEPWQKHRWCIDACGRALTETSMSWDVDINIHPWNSICTFLVGAFSLNEKRPTITVGSFFFGRQSHSEWSTFYNLWFICSTNFLRSKRCGFDSRTKPQVFLCFQK